MSVPEIFLRIRSSADPPTFPFVSLPRELRAKVCGSLDSMRDQFKLQAAAHFVAEGEPLIDLAALEQFDPIAAKAAQEPALLHAALTARHGRDPFSPGAPEALGSLRSALRRERVDALLADVPADAKSKTAVERVLGEYCETSGMANVCMREIEEIGEQISASAIRRLAVAQHRNVSPGGLIGIAAEAAGPDEMCLIAAHVDSQERVLFTDGSARSAIDTLVARANTQAARDAVVERPGVAAALLGGFAKVTNGAGARRRLMMHEQADEAVLAALSARGARHPDERKALREHPHADAQVLANLAKRARDPAERSALLEHRLLPAAAFAGMAASSTGRVERARMLQHPLLCEYGQGLAYLTLLRFANDADDLHAMLDVCDGSALLLKHTAQSASAHDDVSLHRRIIDHENADDAVLAALIGKHTTHGEYLAYLRDPRTDTRTRAAVATYCTSREVRGRLLEHFAACEPVRNALAASAVNPSERRALREHPLADDRTLYLLAQSSIDDDEREALLTHEKTGRLTLTELAATVESAEEGRFIGSHPKANDRIRKIIAVFDTPHNRRILAHANAPRRAEDALPRFDHYYTPHGVQLACARHPAYSVNFGMFDEHPKIELALARRADCRAEQLRNLAARVRYPEQFQAIATHPNADVETLQLLLEGTTRARERDYLLRRIHGLRTGGAS